MITAVAVRERPPGCADSNRPSDDGRTGNRARLILLLGGLIALGPLSIDLYLPALPGIAHDLRAGGSDVQFTLSGMTWSCWMRRVCCRGWAPRQGRCSGRSGCTMIALPETLPVCNRVPPRLGATVGVHARLIADRRFVRLVRPAPVRAALRRQHLVDDRDQPAQHQTAAPLRAAAAAGGRQLSALISIRLNEDVR
jgi:hypothetical protein